jgi:hypothetical protein
VVDLRLMPLPMKSRLRVAVVGWWRECLPLVVGGLDSSE